MEPGLESWAQNQVTLAYPSDGSLGGRVRATKQLDGQAFGGHAPHLRRCTDALEKWCWSCCRPSHAATIGQVDGHPFESEQSTGIAPKLSRLASDRRFGLAKCHDSHRATLQGVRRGPRTPRNLAKPRNVSLIRSSYS